LLRPGMPSLANKYKPWLLFRFTSLIAACLVVSPVAPDRVRNAFALVFAEGEEKKTKGVSWSRNEMYILNEWPSQWFSHVEYTTRFSRTYELRIGKRKSKKCPWAKRVPFLSSEGLPWWGYDFGIWFTYAALK